MEVEDMARPSAKGTMIEAALALIADEGVTALTLDAVAERAGVTKRGLIYHFPTKYDLILTLHAHLATQIDDNLRQTIDCEPEEADLIKRTQAYVQVITQIPNNVAKRLVAEAASETEWLTPWKDLYARWFPEDTDETLAASYPEHVYSRCRIARLAADGFWANETTPASTEMRQHISNDILNILSIKKYC